MFWRAHNYCSVFCLSIINCELTWLQKLLIDCVAGLLWFQLFSCETHLVDLTSFPHIVSPLITFPQRSDITLEPLNVVASWEVAWKHWWEGCNQLSADCGVDVTSVGSVAGLGSEDHVGVKGTNRWPYFKSPLLRDGVIRAQEAKLCHRSESTAQVWILSLWPVIPHLFWEDLSPP